MNFSKESVEESYSSYDDEELQKSIPKFYTIGKDRYLNPGYIHKNVSNKSIDNWPAHSSGLQHPTNQIEIDKNHRVLLLSEHESKLPNLVPKPKFLEFLEKHVKTELTKHKATEVRPSNIRLQIFGEVFEWILQALKSYRPLLASIKREYEMNINFLREKLRKVEPMKELLWTLSQEYDQRLMSVRSQESKQIKTLKEEKVNINKALSDLKSEKETLTVEVNRLKQEVEAQNTLSRTEADARKILISDMNDLRSKLKEMERLVLNPDDTETEKEDPVKLRWAYEQAKLAVTEVNRKLVHMTADYADVVPRATYAELMVKYESMVTKWEHTAEEKTLLETQLNDMTNQYHSAMIQRNHLFLQVKEYKQRLLSNNPLTKPERTQLEKIDARIQYLKDNLNEEIKKWTDLANTLSHDELVNKIEEELQKTDGSADVMMELLIDPAMQKILMREVSQGEENLDENLSD